jgi:hypothetical protein
MAIQIKIDSEAMNMLYRYCYRSPAEVPVVMQRILREWCKMGAKKWYKDRNSIPKMPDIPESRMTAVGINTDIGKLFKNTVKAINQKHCPDGGEVVNEEKLASLLLASFIKVYNVKHLARNDVGLKWGNPG